MIDTPVIDMHSHLGNWGTNLMSDDIDRYLNLQMKGGVEPRP